MIPSLVARELRSSIVEYLATTFALSDDEVYDALTEFLLDPRDGIFRGPYLRVRLPFIDAPPDADHGLQWVPPGFEPYAHQVAAWQRLAGRVRAPKPTLITTGTGSGKSEGFLVPIVDHCIWARGQQQKGIKALILYPMNALVTDQERRIAAMLADPAAQAAGVTGGVWIGDDGSTKPHREMGENHLITDPAALMDDPPDILLTNYKMLDRLLTNESRNRLWAVNTPPADASGWEQPLRYLVLDEFHTYDGAQGTDVAMLLRRLGHRLGIATAQSPLDGVGCVGTSATLGSSTSAVADMCQFATRVFGRRFDAASIVGEQRQTVAEVCPDINFSLPIPKPTEVAALDASDVDALATAFTGQFFDDPVEVGTRLLTHHLTASLLRIASDRPRTWGDAVAGIAQQVPEWGEALGRDPDAVGVALERFVALVSQARRLTSEGDTRPLFSVEVQVWIREVTRVLSAVAKEPEYLWADSPAVSVDQAWSHSLPSVYCTSCGRSGWMGVANRLAGQGEYAIERLDYGADVNTYAIAVGDRSRTRTMLRAGAAEPDVLWLDPTSGQVHAADTDEATRLPVLVAGMTGPKRNEETRDEAAQRQECPSCGTRDALRFLGSRVTTLASVGITQMFGSDHVADDERKLLAFTDSVQDASHRAAFFSGRTHRFNLRATLSDALKTKGRVALPGVAEIVLTKADQGEHPVNDVFSLVPPDLLWEGWLSAAWRQPGTPAADEARKGLATRLGFDAILEAGVRSRLGRTLETTGTAVAEVVITDDEWVEIISFATEAVQANTGLLIAEADDIRTWAHGVVERLRLRGGIHHSFLDRYVAENGNRYRIWGGADTLAPKFPKGISAPSFFSSASSDEFDTIGGPQSWLGLWSKRVLGIEGRGADKSMSDLLHVLSEVGVLEQRSAGKGIAWGIPAHRIEFVDVPPEDGEYPPTELRCDVCAHRHYTTPEQHGTWLGRPCLRLRCTGSYTESATRLANYYRDLYRSGQIRRVVAKEHTGMLNREQRERVEVGFKDGGTPDAPNVLTATPTLEMGIDIGDLSAVMLTAVPRNQSNYVQRVGRAGRATGNAFITTFAESDPRSLYFLHDPELMIAGDITAPSCYLDAIEILRRQYLASLLDQAALGDEGSIPSAGQMPRIIGQTAKSGLNDGGWLSEILEAGKSPDLVAAFVGLFGSHLSSEVAVRLSSWAATDMRQHVDHVIGRWHDHIKALTNQRDRLRDREKPLKEKQNLTSEEEEDLGRISAELRYVAARINSARNQDTLGALEGLGLLPNYTLYDDTVTLEVSMWHREDDPANEGQAKFVTDGREYARPARIAIQELAPGNFFYVDAHRVKIDAIDNGTEHEPAHSIWRLCPACAWASSDVTADVGECPRCGSKAVADQGSLVTVLPMRLVSSTEREASARVSDDTEDRDREYHEIITTVDVEPEDITAAFLHTGTVFGVEACRAARIRYLNFGRPAARAAHSRQMLVAGADVAASLFRVCRHCGSVFGVRGDTNDPDDGRHHRAWCKVRSGVRAPHWDDLALVHELTTEAIRILLPIAEFEAPERIVTFKAALMLGLRDSFGGDPTHLNVLVSSFPAPGGDDSLRNRFVVVHDTVPGGTGYLNRLADPDRLRVILERAVELIATCECQAQGRPGCHKCLYAAVGRRELPLVSREIALEMLDEILLGWNLKPAEKGTITGVNLSKVRQSELERMFKVLLHRWSGTGKGRVTSHPDPEFANHTRFDVRFQDGPHWEIREQVNLAAHQTVPDFYATRVDVPGFAPVAIYLDGWEFHGADQDQVDKDSARRASLRAAGIGVWALTWADVKGALGGVNKGAAMPAVLPLPTGKRHAVRNQAEQILGGTAEAFKSVDLGAFDQLMLFLEVPELDVWRALATGLAVAPAQGAARVMVESAESAVTIIASGGSLAAIGHETDVGVLTWHSTTDLPCSAIAERGVSTPRSVVSLDTDVPPSHNLWADWLHLGNLLQHLGDRAVIATTRSYAPDAVSPETVAAPAAGDGGDLLGEVLDPAAIPLARAAIEAGRAGLEVGFGLGDPDDTPIEIAWPAAKVGILPTGGSDPGEYDGWMLRFPSGWTESELLQALEARS